MKRLNKYLPKSLFGRSLLIIVLPVLIMQTAVMYFFFNAHWTQVTANMSDSVAADVSVAVELYKQAPSQSRTEALDAMLRPHMELSVALDENDGLPTTTRDAFFSVLDKTLKRALDQALTDEFWFDTTRYPNHIDIRVAVDEGVLRFIAARERVFAPTGFVFIFWLVTATLLLTLVSIMFIRNQAKPITKLAAAADAFGKGEETHKFRPSGASEVRVAGHSFLKMRDRITRHIEQRATLLAGVSHDLRTPLTRLKLHLAMQEKSEDNDAAINDLKDMESMLKGYLDFAQGLPGETSETVELRSWINEIIQGLPGRKPEFSGDETVELSIKKTAMKRALTNILTNAQKYGQSCRVTIDQRPDHVLIAVEDDGPGIPPDKYESVFKPFQRLDDARNQNIEGVGLGLTISRDIVQGHGGRLTLDDSDLGGLKAVIRLPR